MNKVLRSGLVLASTCASFCVANNVSALTYQDGTPVQFTFNSTLSISLSDTDIVIGNLIPGQDDTSNAVDVVVNTNNLYGYTLTATVGSATKDYRDLRHTNGTASFASIDVNSDLSTLSGESSSVWGYTTSTNGTTWSNFSGLPKYDDTTNTAELNVTDGAAEDSTTSFKIGAFAAEGQLAGDYTNVINFIVTSNVGKTYIQDVTSATCPTEPTIVYDIRDEEEYLIQKLADNRCWMLDNLRLDSATLLTSLSIDNTNLDPGTPFTLPASTTHGFGSNSAGYVTPQVNTDYKNALLSYGDGVYSAKTGAYYNYCAATAGTYCYDDYSGVNDAEYDICPRGWRLPTGDSLSDNNEYADLYDAYNDLSEIMNVFRVALTGALYSDYPDEGIITILDENSVAHYWTSSFYDYADMFTLYAYSTGFGTGDNWRFTGQSVRCVAK